MAYGARLESVLGASPRGFESPILRNLPRNFVEVPGFFIVRVRKSHGSWRGSVLVFSFLFSAIRAIKGNKNPTASASVAA